MAFQELPFEIIPWLTEFGLEETEISDALLFCVNIGSALTVSAAANATPIRITTTTVHGLSSGHAVFISGVVGNTAANGYFDVTVINTTQFDLRNSVGNGAWVSGGSVQRVCRGRGRSVDLGVVRIGRLAVPWNYCSSTGGSPARSRRIMY